MARLLRLVVLVAAGYLAARLLGAHDITDSSLYLYATALLLAIGLYGSTVGIDVGHARHDLRTILLAVTVGVLGKAILIGGALALAFQDPLFLVLGVVVAQIDPLSVAAILTEGRMSVRARSILASWASFDDPLTVILSVYAAAIAAGVFGLGENVTQIGVGDGLIGYGIDLGLNLLFAAAAFVLWRGVRSRPVLAYVALVALVVAAVAWFLMLGLALAGLFFRPRGMERLVGRLTTGALAVAAVLLGVLLVGGMSPWRGLALGTAAYAAQIIVGWLLTRRLPVADRAHLAFAQQNGITAIILALRMEALFTGVVGVVAPAILVTNSLHWVANHVLDRRLARAASQPGPPTDPGVRSSGTIQA